MFFYPRERDQPLASRSLTAVICLRRQEPSIRVASTRLPSGLISLGDGVRLLHAPHAFRPRHQDGCFRRFDGAACSNSQRDCRHTFVVRHIADEDGIILAEAIPTTNEFAPNGLARLTSDGFNAVLRIFELGGPRVRSVGCLIHIERHVRPPFATCVVWL